MLYISIHVSDLRDSRICRLYQIPKLMVAFHLFDLSPFAIACFNPFLVLSSSSASKRRRCDEIPPQAE
jgi:hypothetical protein